MIARGARFAAIAIACGCAGVEPSPPSPPSRHPITFARPAPIATATPEETEAPTAEPPSPFQLAAISGEEGTTFSIHLLGSTLLVADPTNGLLLEARGDEVVWDPALLAGLPRSFFFATSSAGTTIHDVAGRWPDPVWMVTIPGADPRIDGFHIHRLRRDRWVAEPHLLRVPIGGYGWIRPLGKRILAIYDEHRSSPDERPVLQVMHGPPAGVLPRMPCFEPPGDLATSPSGELFLVAAAPLRCRDEKSGPEGRPAVLYAWEKDTRDPRVIRLPRGFLPGAVLALSRTDVRITGTIRDEGGELPAVAHFDGVDVATQYLPGQGHPHSMTAEPDGTLWIAGPTYTATDNGLWRKLPHGGWRAVRLPHVPEDDGNRVSPWQIVARGQDDVWMSGSAGAKRGLFHTKPPPRVLAIPTQQEVWRTIRVLNRKDLPPSPPGAP